MVFGLACLTLSCDNTQSPTLFEPSLSVDLEGAPRPIVVGKTNLPDGTELMITIGRAESNYEAQSKTAVTDGRFKSEQFSELGEDLKPGTYAVKVLMPIPAVQPAAVQRIIGNAGQYLQGPLVKQGDLGVTVSYTTTFTVGKNRKAP